MLTVIAPGTAASPRFTELLKAAVGNHPAEQLDTLTTPLENRRILFAVSLNEGGINHAFSDLLFFLRTHTDALCGCVGGVLVDCGSDLYTKAAGRDLVLAASMAGCIFPGRCLVEITGSLQNYVVQAKNAACSLEAAYRLAATDLTERILTFSPPKHERPNVLVLHASNHRTSNTMALWSRVRERLNARCDITEIGLRNGTLEDCSGCPYTMCLHFGEKEDCFYGGVMVQEVYPAIRAADAVVLLCPNYNDALSANLTAAINRLTALYRTSPFTDTAVFAVIVSGYSGGDIVASQVVSAMNMNKSFWLPAEFCMLETANDAGTALRLPDIESRLEQFSQNILRQMLKEQKEDP